MLIISVPNTYLAFCCSVSRAEHSAEFFCQMESDGPERRMIRIGAQIVRSAREKPWLRS